MVATYPQGSNTYVKNHEATGKMVVDFSRNVSDFAINRYAQIIPVEKDEGYYLEMTVEEAGRIVNSDLADFVWNDGADRPDIMDGTESFNFKPYRTIRYNYGYRIGGKAVKQASWDVIAQHGRIKAQQAMTARTLKVSTALTTSGNYAASHTADVASGITGNTGTWAASTTARQDIKRSLHHGMNQILLDTLGVVNQEDLHLVLSPDAARAISQSQEIVDYLKGSPDAYAQVKGEIPGRNKQWGLPDTLYGLPVEVEKTVRVTTRKGATPVKSFVWPAASAAIVARPGELEAPYGGPNFSTVALFMYEEMTVEDMYVKNDRVHKGNIVEDFEARMIAPVSGFLFTNIK